MKRKRHLVTFSFIGWDPGGPQPLLNMALDGLARASDEDMVLALKALGNAGHPASIKTVLRFLPAVAANPVALPARVQSAAVQALRLIAARDPHAVRQTRPPPPTDPAVSFI